MEALGSYMRRRRDELDLSLREFAKRLDCSAAFISDIELGRRNPSEKVLADIARVLGVKLEDLQAMDVRAPIEEIKRLTQNDPRYALAFRTMIDKKVSAEELLKLANQKREVRAAESQEMKTFRSQSGPFAQRPHFEPVEIDRICTDELRKAGSVSGFPASQFVSIAL